MWLALIVRGRAATLWALKPAAVVAGLLILYLQSSAAQVTHDQTPWLQQTWTVKNRHVKDKDTQGD